MILHFVKMMGILRFSKTYSGKKSFKNAKKHQFVRGISKTTYQNMLGFGGSKFEKFSKFRKLRYAKIRFVKDVPIFFLYFVKSFDDKKEL